MKKITLLICLLNAYLAPSLFSQKTTFEKINEVCEGTPVAQRPRITVARFSVATPKAAYEFGAELSTMLSSALQQTSCFRVLESIDNFDDMADEIDLGDSKYTRSGSSPKAGQMMGAQFIITGEVTEYNEGNTGIKFSGLGIGGGKADIGFILKIVNPATREIIYSKSVNTQGKKGFQGLKLLGFEAIGGNFKNKAVADACEKGIIKAVELLAEQKDNLTLAGDSSSAFKNGQATSAFTNIELVNATFQKVRMLEKTLKAISSVQSVDKVFNNGEAFYDVAHTGNLDDLLDKLMSQIQDIEVHGYEANKITLELK